jgi:hypothetical protein
MRKRFACSECGETYSSIKRAAKCHWGIAGVVDREQDPELYELYAKEG